LALENDDVRMTKLGRMAGDQMSKYRSMLCSSFPRCASFVIRLSCFVIRSPRRSLAKAADSPFGIRRTALLVVIAQMCCSALAQAEAPNMTGIWNVEITFANAQHHSVRFEAQDGGKGSLQLTDPAAKVWSGAKSSEAKWSRGEGDSVTFSGPVEFLLGNVGRDAGTLTCKGKFETADLISGEVDFSPSVGERPSRHGTFKAVRAVK
jgi:hypothetical protein